MNKIAVFVEGRAELILIREFLLHMFEYQNVRIECYALLNDNLNDVPYDFGERSAADFYMIINVGNDNSVLSQIKNRAQSLSDKGFSKILGLRDVYGEKYKEKNNRQRTINKELIKRFSDVYQEQIELMDCSEKIKFFFAVMEVEAWFLGFRDIFLAFDSGLTCEYIKSQLGYDLEKDDPENTYYHPAKVIGDIFQLVGKRYDKHERDISPLINPITKEQYDELIEADKCATFTKFVEELLAK